MHKAQNWAVWAIRGDGIGQFMKADQNHHNEEE